MFAVTWLKFYNLALWFLLSFLFSPLIGVILILDCNVKFALVLTLFFATVEGYFFPAEM